MCANTDLLMRRDNQIHGTKETYRRSINKSQRESLWERAGAHANHHLFVFLPLLETMHVLARMGPMHTNRERERERKGERARESATKPHQTVRLQSRELQALEAQLMHFKGKASNSTLVSTLSPPSHSLSLNLPLSCTNTFPLTHCLTTYMLANQNK